MSNKGYKSQPLDFLVYEDTVDYDLVADHEILGLTNTGELAQTSVIISFTQTQGSITTSSTEGTYIVKKNNNEISDGIVADLTDYKLEINNITEVQLPITIEWSIGEQLVDSMTITRDSKDGVGMTIQRAYCWSSDYLWEPTKPTTTVDNTTFTDTNEKAWTTSAPPPNIFESETSANIIFVTERSYLANLDPTNVPWSKPEVFLVRDERAYNILKTADGLFGYGQGVYYTYDPTGYKEIDSDYDVTTLPTAVNGWSARQPIPATQSEIAKWIVNGDAEVNKISTLNSVENRKSVIKLYINAEYIQTGALKVENTDGGVLFEAGLDNNTVSIGGFEVNGTNLYSTAPATIPPHPVALTDITKIYRVHEGASESEQVYSGEIALPQINLNDSSNDYIVAIFTPNSSIPSSLRDLSQELESLLTKSYWMMSYTTYTNTESSYVAGQILVYDSTVEETLENGTSLYNKWIIYEYDSGPATWYRHPEAYFLTNTIIPLGSVYVGTDRIQLGDKFIVDNLGNITATGLRAEKITVKDDEDNILLSANDEVEDTLNKVKIGGFEVDSDKLEAISTETTVAPILFINPDKSPQEINVPFYRIMSGVSWASWTASMGMFEVDYWQYTYDEDAKRDTVVLYITETISNNSSEFKYIDKVSYNNKEYDHWQGKIVISGGLTQLQLLTSPVVESFETVNPKVKLSTKELFLGTSAPKLNIEVPEYLYNGSKVDTLYFPAHTLFNTATYESVKSIGYTAEGKLTVSLEYKYTEIIIPRASEFKDLVIDFTYTDKVFEGNTDFYKPATNIDGSNNSTFFPRKVAQVTPPSNDDTTSGDTNNNDETTSEQKTTIIEVAYTLKSFSIADRKIYWESANGEVISSSYYLYNNGSNTNRAALYEVHYKESYFQVFPEGAVVANRVNISGEISAQTGKIGGFTIEGNSLSSSAVNLSPQSLTLTGASLRIDDINQNNGISIETIGSTPIIEVLGKAKLQNKEGNCGFEWSNGEINKTYTFRPILSATGTDGWGGTNTATIKLEEKNDDNTWTTATNLLKARSFTIYTKGYDYGDKVRSQTITLNPGESTATISFGGYWDFYGVAWSASATEFIKGAGNSVVGSTFSQGINSGQTLYSLGSIMPKGTKQLQSITVYYSTGYGAPIHTYDYIGTINAYIGSETTETTLDAWQTNSSQAPTWVYTKVSDNEKITGISYLSVPTYYNYTKINNKNSVSIFFNPATSSSSSNSGQIVTRTVTSNDANLGDNDHKWTNIYGTNIYGTLTTPPSDIRIKSDISKDISKYDSLFDSLQPASYKLNPLADNKTYLGFIAQDIEQSLIDNNLTKADFGCLNITGSGYDNIKHEVIEYDKTAYHISYNDLHALEVRQIQLLKARVKELEEKIEKLTTK